MRNQIKGNFECRSHYRSGDIGVSKFYHPKAFRIYENRMIRARTIWKLHFSHRGLASDRKIGYTPLSMQTNSTKTNRATFRFYEELNEFLSESMRKRPIVYTFFGHPSVKDAVEAQGVPHTEVDLILVNGISVDFNHALRDGDFVSVYPVFESLDISPVIRLRPEPLREPKFILDVQLGRLARLMRLVGLDTLYQNNYKDGEIVDIALRDRRIILTMDRHLLKRKAVTHGVWIRSRDPESQIVEVIGRFDLKARLDPFSRCIRCNGRIESVEKNRIIQRLAPRTKIHFDTFAICPHCDRIYWHGSHYDRMRDRLVRWIGDSARSKQE
jgi:uncharacterized protein with PIN domain